MHPDIVRAGVLAMAVLALVIGEGSRRGRYLRRVSLVQIESKCDRRVNPAAMPRLHFATPQLGRRHSRREAASLSSTVKADAAKWWPIIKELGIKAE